MNNLSLNCIVIDDSPTQRLSTSRLVEKHPNLVLIDAYPNAIIPSHDLVSNKVDVIFLDIEMPIISGFDFLEELEKRKDIKNKPQIILSTSKADYALKAFDYTITDYLQKPLQIERFNIAVNRALKLKHQISNVSSSQPFIVVKSNLKKVKVQLNEIMWIEALGDYVKIITRDKAILVLSSMKSFITRLPSDKFIRVHKSYIANIDKIDNFSTNTIEVGEYKLPMSRSKRNDLENILELH